MGNETKCPMCGHIMKRVEYVSTFTGEVVKTSLECPHCGMNF